MPQGIHTHGILQSLLGLVPFSCSWKLSSSCPERDAQFLKGLLGHISQVLHAKKEMLQQVSVSSEGMQPVWGDGVRERKHFSSYSNLKSCSSLQQRPICPPGRGKLCALHTLLRLFRMWESQPHGRNLILWQNPLGERCRNAVDIPAQDWDCACAGTEK